jgi:phosphoglucomutase
MDDFRSKTPNEVGGEKIIALKDFKELVHRNLETGELEKLDFPKSNVVQFFTDKGTKITARPSGTEPKIKFYISVNTALNNKEDFQQVKSELEGRIDAIKKSLGL